MPQYLLDTHTLVWMQNDDSTIPVKLKNLLSSPDAQLSISIVSLWEMVIKNQLGRLDLKFSLSDNFKYCTKNRIVIKPILPDYLEVYHSLPLIHRDPFDRMIIATAIFDNIVLVSKDGEVSKYPVTVIW